MKKFFFLLMAFFICIIWFVDDEPKEKSHTKPQHTSEENKISSLKANYILECKELVKAWAKYPSSVNAHTIMGSSVEMKADYSAKIYLEFEAKNDFGNELPYVAYCKKTSPSESMEISQITKR